MDLTGYTKLFSSIVASSIWREPYHIKIVWVTMLALSDYRGIVSASIPGLASLAGVKLDECEEALKILLSPDPYSRTKDHEGRRISEVDGGWAILNRNKYRDAQNEDERREYRRKWMKENRAREQPREQHVNKREQMLTPREQMLTQAEAEAETEAEKEEEEESPLPPKGGCGGGNCESENLNLTDSATVPEMVKAIMGARTEFRAIKPMAFETALAACPDRTARLSAVRDFLSDAVNALKCPSYPVKMLSAYIRQAMKTSGYTVKSKAKADHDDTDRRLREALS